MTTLKLAAPPKASPSSPDGPAWTDTVCRLDEAYGKRWSFRVVSYELRRWEIVVLGELDIAGQARQQFGAAHIQGYDFGETARAAILDALIACAALFRVGLDDGQQEPPPLSPLRQRLDQVRDAIERLPGGRQAFREVLRQFEVRKAEHLPEEALPDVISRCEQIYRVPPPPSANGRSAHP